LQSRAVIYEYQKRIFDLSSKLTQSRYLCDISQKMDYIKAGKVRLFPAKFPMVKMKYEILVNVEENMKRKLVPIKEYLRNERFNPQRAAPRGI
jgi:hypothetical protein